MMHTTPDSASLDALIAPTIALARSAGAAILAVYRQPIEVIAKADASPLTIADLRAHELIVRGLSTLTPAIPILSEEASEIPFAARSNWQQFWLVDPLDGTKEFLARNDEFTVNIALIVGHVPVLGVVYAPAQNALYWGGAELGAFRLIDDGAVEAIQARAPAPATLRVVGSRSHAGTTLIDARMRLGPHELVQLGSSLKFCAIAEGRADVYPRLGPTSEWDTAAGQAIAEGAGAAVLDAKGRPLRYNTKDSLLNPHFVAFGDRTKDWSRLLFHTE